jgi:hypothetical protein
VEYPTNRDGDGRMRILIVRGGLGVVLPPDDGKLKSYGGCCVLRGVEGFLMSIGRSLVQVL